jgi:hypothetical protein
MHARIRFTGDFIVDFVGALGVLITCVCSVYTHGQGVNFCNVRVCQVYQVRLQKQGVKVYQVRLQKQGVKVYQVRLQKQGVNFRNVIYEIVKYQIRSPSEIFSLCFQISSVLSVKDVSQIL